MRDSSPDLVRFVTRSDRRPAVLRAVASGASTRRAVTVETGLDRSAAGRLLRELCRRRLVERADCRYRVTPLGACLAEGLQALLDSVGAAQRFRSLLQGLADADPGLGLAAPTACEVLTPTTRDPHAPGRRFADRLQTVTRARLLVPALAPVVFDTGFGSGVDATPGSGGAERTCELVVPRAALGATCDGTARGTGVPSTDRSGAPRRPRHAFPAEGASLFAFDGTVPHLVGTLDEFGVVGLIDDAGAVRGYVETTDGAVRSWAAETVEAHRGASERVGTGPLTT